MTFHTSIDFHEVKLMAKGRPIYAAAEDTEFTYTFHNFYHPHISKLIEKLNRESLAGMLDADFHKELEKAFFTDFYTPQSGELVKFTAFPVKNIDLSYGGPYANYNWELLFHIPLAVAVHLSRNQRFAEAQTWFHYIFDPTSSSATLPPLKRYWKFLAFREAGSAKPIDEQLALLSGNDPADDAVRAQILAGYRDILRDPFRPHAVARTRQLAYQYNVVMKYLDNLIAWGDTLFRQDTVESNNEATQRYILAANILGRRPEQVTRRADTRPMNYAELRKAGLDAMSNALVELEGKFPFNLGLPQNDSGDTEAAAPLFGIGRALYFCVPRNEQILRYWDLVGDRLYKLRHCLNIEGVFRQLALFDPPIDPGMLAKAAAAGIDVGSILGGLNQPLGPVRAQFYIQKALELCGEVRALGGALLAAIEKGDGERMALLRQDHEIRMHQAAQEVRFLQWKQAQESTESLLRTRASALERYRYYQRLMGLVPDGSTAPETLPLNRRKLTEENFDEAYAALVEQYDRPIAAQAYPKLVLASGGSPVKSAGKLFLNANEGRELNDILPHANNLRMAAGAMSSLASVLTFIPDFNAKLAFWGLGAGSQIFGGNKMSDALKITAEVVSNEASRQMDKAGMISRTASYERRADEWMLQSNLAARELVQLGRQLIGALIAEQVAQQEYLNVKQQIAHAEEVAGVLREKFSDEKLYLWMQGELSRLYYEYYRLAFDTSRKAELIAKRELMREEVDAMSFVKFNYWDAGRKGLLSGEALHLDLKRLELAYHENNKREHELTKHVSLRQLDPLALMALKAGGACEVSLPEWLFDLDTAGHFMRRIRSVSLSIPSVTGPYVSVNCTLSLLKSTLRKSPLLEGGEYARQSGEDGRFIDYFGTIQSIVTSGSLNDSGMFEANLRDERLLPFEGAGAESTWSLELPANLRQFDYDTIADVVLHVRYTARPGGKDLRSKAEARVAELVAQGGGVLQALVFDLRRDMPAEWQKFVADGTKLELAVKREYFPYLAQRRPAITIEGVQLQAISNDKVESRPPEAGVEAAVTQQLQNNGEFRLSLAADAKVLKPDRAARVFLVVKYSL